MDANFISEAINTLGFPIAMVATLGWYIQKKDKEKAIVDAEIRERSNAERDMLIASIEITTEAEDVSNGDKYKVTIDFDKKYEDAVGISMGSGSRKIKAAGIQKGTAI